MKLLHARLRDEHVFLPVRHEHELGPTISAKLVAQIQGVHPYETDDVARHVYLDMGPRHVRDDFLASKYDLRPLGRVAFVEHRHFMTNARLAPAAILLISNNMDQEYERLAMTGAEQAERMRDTAQNLGLSLSTMASLDRVVDGIMQEPESIADAVRGLPFLHASYIEAMVNKRQFEQDDFVDNRIAGLLKKGATHFTHVYFIVEQFVGLIMGPVFEMTYYVDAAGRIVDGPIEHAPFSANSMPLAWEQYSAYGDHLCAFFPILDAINRKTVDVRWANKTEEKRGGCKHRIVTGKK